jgi:hypothetical protein
MNPYHNSNNRDLSIHTRESHLPLGTAYLNESFDILMAVSKKLLATDVHGVTSQETVTRNNSQPSTALYQVS